MFPLVILPVFYSLILWASFALVARITKKRPRYGLLILYIVFMAMFGPLGEIALGTLYHAISGFPLWQYQVFPLHHGYTSYYAPIIWGLGGGFLYVSQELIGISKRHKTIPAALFIMFEIISIEVILNLSFLALSGGLLFHYTPGDLGHVSSLQTLPFYFLAGIILLKSIKRLKQDWLFFSLMLIAILFVVLLAISN